MRENASCYIEISATEEYHYTIYYPHADLLSGTGKEEKDQLGRQIHKNNNNKIEYYYYHSRRDAPSGDPAALA